MKENYKICIFLSFHRCWSQKSSLEIFLSNSLTLQMKGLACYHFQIIRLKYNWWMRTYLANIAADKDEILDHRNAFLLDMFQRILYQYTVCHEHNIVLVLDYLTFTIYMIKNIRISYIYHNNTSNYDIRLKNPTI